jgi:pyruvate dehydrogenase E2 component (dihydrolipoamide acetyltransferase)
MTNDPEPLTIVMPKLGLTMTEATLTRWLKAEGAVVAKDELLFEFESDKSLLEYECPADGVLRQILVAEGETVPCGTPVAYLQGSRVTGVQGRRAAEGKVAAQPIAAPTKVVSSSAPSATYAGVVATPAAKRQARILGIDLTGLTGRGPQGRIHLADVEAVAQTITTPTARTVTPMAERLASELGVDWTRLGGSGPGGRVLKEDVLQAAPTAEPVATARIQPLTGVRGVIASRMSESAFSAPHVTLFSEADASALVEARSQLNAELAGANEISYNTLLIAILARLLPDHPALNACIVGNEIYFYEEVNIALAVETERGLLAPVIRQADRLDLITIQQTGNALIERAMAGKSLPDDLSGGTFTLTNLGMFDVDGFTPIINQPQAAILGVGRIVAKPVVAANGEVVVRQMMTLSLSFDHRIVDGAPAARFLQRVKQLIERPFALMLGH